jgi:hypothetical protein
MKKHRPAEHISSARSDHLRTMDAKLDAALAATFPASDPVAITVSRLRHERASAIASWKQGEPSWTD